MSFYVTLNKSLSYENLNLRNDQQNNKLYFDLLFSVSQQIKIENRGIVLITTNDIFIVKLMSIITFESSNNPEKKEFVFYHDYSQTNITFGGNILFNSAFRISIRRIN
jgi:hypothetical protein